MCSGCSPQAACFGYNYNVLFYTRPSCPSCPKWPSETVGVSPTGPLRAPPGLRRVSREPSPPPPAPRACIFKVSSSFRLPPLPSQKHFLPPWTVRHAFSGGPSPRRPLELPAHCVSFLRGVCPGRALCRQMPETHFVLHNKVMHPGTWSLQ